MKVPVYTDEQFLQMNSSFEITPGVYDFIVIKAEEKKSKAGNDMVEVQLQVNTQPKEITVYDYLTVLPESHKAHGYSVEKIKNFLECIKLPYEGEIRDTELINKEGKVLLKLEHNKEKNKNYARVDIYMTDELLKKYNHEHEQVESKDFDDDIPF